MSVSRDKAGRSGLMLSSQVRMASSSLSAPGPGTAPAHWVAPPFRAPTPPPDLPSPRGPLTVLVQHAPGPIVQTSAVAGFVMDEWVEVLPRRVKPPEGDGAPDDDASPSTIEAPTTTALAVNANSPNARAPQALLLAVSPNRRPWNKATLEATLLETLELAKLRAVTLETVVWVARLLPALYFPDFGLQGGSIPPFLQFAKNAASARPIDLLIKD